MESPITTMAKNFYGLVISAVLLVKLPAALALAGSSDVPQKCYLFSFFRNPGTNGMQLAWSRDGLKWRELSPPGKSFLPPTVGGGIMRDPCLRQGPDGVFHVV